MKKYEPILKDYKHILHGGDYNPEQWMDTKEIWDEDIRLMKKAGCNEMTVGIFSWSHLEPEEGKFDFSWLDEIIDKVYNAGGRVILATPSGARPHWMSDKYPEVLRTGENGQRDLYGGRHNHCLSSPVYREKVRIINEKLSERYGNHPAVAAWHLSNEYNGACYCPMCCENFRKWLSEKYDHDINKLNHAWWSSFWSHKYDSFDQIDPPMASGGESFMLGLNLDFKRYVSDMTVDFAKKEAEAVRKYSDKPLTTNCMCEISMFDHYDMAKVLDRTSFDSYPNWYFGIEGEANRVLYLCALYRGMKDGKPFIIMESAPGINAGGVEFRTLKSNEVQFMEEMSYVANGADMVGYFQWRKGRGGYEKFHGAVVDHYGKEDSRVFKSIENIGKALKKLDGVVGTGIKSEVAITHDYDTIWALEGNTSLTVVPTKNGYLNTAFSLFSGFRKKNIPADVISYEADFSKYKVVCMPAPYLIDEALAEKIKNYVKDGGILVSTYLTGVADENDLCHLGGVPGLGLTELFGLRTDEVDGYMCSPYLKNSVSFKGQSYPVNAIAEVIVPMGAEVLASYENDYYKGSGAAFVNSYGKGKAYYIGFEADRGFMEKFIDFVTNENDIESIAEITADPGVNVTLRAGDGEKYYFVINYTDEQKNYKIGKSMYNVLSDAPEEGLRTIEPCGVRVYTEK